MAINLGNIVFGVVPNLSQMQAAIGAVQRFSSAFVTGANQQAAAANNAAAATNRFANSVQQAQRPVRGLVGNLHTLSQVFTLYSGPMGSVATRLNTLSLLMGRIGSSAGLMTGSLTLGVGAFSALSSTVYDVEKILDKSTRTLTAITGSTADASNAQRDLMTIAQQSGQSFSDLLDPYNRWLAAIKDTGLEGDRGKEAFTKLSGSMTILGVTGEEAKNAFLALQQMLSKGVVTAEELRKQFGNAMPAAMKVAADALGVTQDKLMKMVTNKEIAPDEFISKLADAYAKFTGLDLSKPITGITPTVNRLSNAMFTLWDAIDKNYHIVDNIIWLFNRWSTTIEWTARNIGKLKDFWNDLMASLKSGGAGVLRFLGDVFESIGEVKGSKTFTALGNDARQMASDLDASAKKSTEAVRSHATALQGALAPTRAYIDAQKNQAIQQKSINDQYIASTRQMVDERRKAMEGANEHAEAFEKNAKDGADPVTYAKKLLDLKLRAQEAGDAYKEAQHTLEELEKIGKKPTDRPFSKPVQDDAKAAAKAAAEAKRVAKALREADQEIQRYGRLSGGMSKGATEFERLKRAMAIDKEVENWRDRMFDAGVPAAQLEERVTKLREVLSRFQEEDLNMQKFATPFQVMADMFDQLTAGVDQFVDALVRGELTWQTFADIGKQMIAELIKELMKLAIMNPLKNLLFGTELTTLRGGVNGGPGVGGFFGSLFSASHGMAVTPGGMRFAGGGILGGPTMMRSPVGPVLGGEAGAEAIMPLMRHSDGKLGIRARVEGGRGESPSGSPVQVHFHGAPPGTRVEEREDGSGGGGRRLDAYFGDMTAQQVSKRGGPVQKALANTFGLQQRTIRRGLA
jgi:tape measure domain-containing protein